MTNLNFLLTGGSGFIGSNLLHIFQELDIPCYQLLRSAPFADQFASLLQSVSNDTRFVFLHAASATPVNTHTLDIYASNTNMASDIVQFLSEERRISKLINLSSVSVYGVHGKSVVDEECTHGVMSEYGASKYAVENAFTSFATTAEIPVVQLRLPGIVGPGSYKRSMNFISRLRYLASRHQPLIAMNPNSPFNNIVHVDDLSNILLQLSGDMHRTSGIFNLGCYDSMPISKVVFTMVSELCSRSTIEWVKADTDSFSVSIDKARDEGLALASTFASLERYCRGPE